jgi:hypothetical protein
LSFVVCSGVTFTLTFTFTPWSHEMKTLHVFVPLLNKSFTGEMKNCVAAESNKYPVVYRMLDSSRIRKMKPKLSVRLNQGGASAPMYFFMNTSWKQTTQSKNHASHPPTLRTVTHRWIAKDEEFSSAAKANINLGIVMQFVIPWIPHSRRHDFANF